MTHFNSPLALLFLCTVFNTPVVAATVTSPPRNLCAVAQDPIEDIEARKLIASLYPIIRNVISHTPSISWASSFLTNKPPENALRIQEIINLLFEDGSALFTEVSRRIDELGGVQSPSLWNEYFRTYDKTFGNSEGYQDLVAHAQFFLTNSHVAPSRNYHFLDVGAGTGNFSSALLVGPRNRYVVGVDLSDFGLRLAASKAKAVAGGSATRFIAIHGSFLDAKLDRQFDGVVMNNVFYTMNNDQRRTALKKIFKALKPGGRFFLSDPLPKVQNASSELKDFVMSAMSSAASTGSPLTEFDIAFAGAMNIFFMRKSPEFLSTQQLIDIGRAAGFEPLDWEIGYYGQVSSIEFVKPN